MLTRNAGAAHLRALGGGVRLFLPEYVGVWPARTQLKNGYEPMSEPDPDGDKPGVSEHEVALVLVKNHRAFLGFLARRLGSREDAEDVLQDFCLKALSRRDQLRDSDSIVAWLYALLRSSLVDHYRKRGRLDRVTHAYGQEMKSVQEAVDEKALHEGFCACLHKLLPALRPDQAELVRRIDLGQEDRASLAADLGVTPGTLAVRLHRARQALGQALMASCTSCPEHGFDDCSCNPDKSVKTAQQSFLF